MVCALFGQQHGWRHELRDYDVYGQVLWTPSAESAGFVKKTTGISRRSPHPYDTGHKDIPDPDSLMSALGHVGTAPWQELSDVGAALVGCGRVSGLFVRAVVAAGHNAFARIGSQSLARTLKCDDPNGFSRSLQRPCLHYVVMSSPIPSKLQLPILSALPLNFSRCNATT